MAKLNKNDWLYVGTETTSVVCKVDITAIVPFIEPADWADLRDRALWKDGYRSIVYTRSGVSIATKRDASELVADLLGEQPNA